MPDAAILLQCALWLQSPREETATKTETAWRSHFETSQRPHLRRRSKQARPKPPAVATADRRLAKPFWPQAEESQDKTVRRCCAAAENQPGCRRRLSSEAPSLRYYTCDLLRLGKGWA